MADAGNASAADLLITGMAQLATAPAPGPRAGSDQAQIVVIPDAAMALADGRIVWTGPRDEWRGSTRLEVSAGNRAVIPALVDPHTHAIWAGDRLADFEARARGEKYEEILARGGGIRSTVEATSGAAASLLVDSAAARVNALVAS